MKKLNKILTKEFLEQKYLIEKLSMAQIAKLVGSNATTLLNYLKKYNIPRRTISEAKKGELHPFYGKHHSEQAKKKMSEAKKGKNNSMYGKHHTEEWRKKISEVMIGKNNSNWKGGRRKHSDGYILVYSPNHPYADKNSCIYKHRLVVEEQIGRYLTPKEHIHHINGIKNDNNPENLIAFASNSAHIRFHKNPKLVKSEEIIFDGRKFKKETRNEKTK